jgi:hypothetical protein
MDKISQDAMEIAEKICQRKFEEHFNTKLGEKKVYIEKSHLRMGLQMTDEDIMSRVASIMDGRKITYTDGGPVHKAAGQKPTYCLTVGGEPAHFWTELMLPYLGKRRKEKYFMLCEKLNEHLELVESYK